VILEFGNRCVFSRYQNVDSDSADVTSGSRSFRYVRLVTVNILYCMSRWCACSWWCWMLTQDDDDEDKYADDMAMPGQKFETKQRITVRNLRIREDTAKVCHSVIWTNDNFNFIYRARYGREPGEFLQQFPRRVYCALNHSTLCFTLSCCCSCCL